MPVPMKFGWREPGNCRYILIRDFKGRRGGTGSQLLKKI